MKLKRNIGNYLPFALIVLLIWTVIIILLTSCSTNKPTEKSIYTNYSAATQPEIHGQIMFLLEKGFYLDKDKIIRVLPKIEHKQEGASYDNIWFWEDEESGVTYIITPQGGITPRLDLDGSIVLSRRIQAELNNKQLKEDDNNNNNFNRQQSEQSRNTKDITN